MGMAGSAAGSVYAQGHGADVQRTQQELVQHARQSQSAEKAEDASGVGQTAEDEGADDRDADGRRLWEAAAEGDPQPEPEAPRDEPRSKDPTGQAGSQLDLSG
jgi:hypothetical protein